MLAIPPGTVCAIGNASAWCDGAVATVPVLPHPLVHRGAGGDDITSWPATWSGAPNPQVATVPPTDTR
jgi:hypothetical protein